MRSRAKCHSGLISILYLFWVVLLFVAFVVAFEVDPFVALFLHVGDELFYIVFLGVLNSRHQIDV